MNLLDSVLIGLIAMHPRTGYDLSKYLERNGRIFGYSPKSSQIYRQLSSLVERGLLVFNVDSNRAGPDAKVYALTEDGWRGYQAWIDEEYVPTPRPLDANFQLRFLLAGISSPSVALRLVSEELDYRLEQERDRDVLRAPEEFVVHPESGFHAEWIETLTGLSEARGYQLAMSHIAWLTTTKSRLLKLVSRHDSEFNRFPGEP
ncbi:PadR family transcriptional regulator [Microbacteriaceae bacterium VKM Ac-2855]|nr:PadR family transcriptional regulator [Microbacteriaceae bacterium VKM Ac-2855]